MSLDTLYPRRCALFLAYSLFRENIPGSQPLAVLLQHLPVVHLRMGIKAVYHVEIFLHTLRSVWAIGCGASAQHQDIDLVLHGQQLYIINLHIC